MTATNPGYANLVSWWKLDELSGTRYDAHGTNHLTDNNTVLYGTGVVGNAADFEATNVESLSIADNATFPNGLSDFTIGCWVSFESTPSTWGYYDLITKMGASGSGENEWRLDAVWQGLLVTNARFSCFNSNGHVGSGVTGAMAENINSGWHFLVAWYDASEELIYIQTDGGTPRSTSFAGGIYNTAAPVVFGGRSYTYHYEYDGLMDEAFIYNRVLEDGHREWLYNSGAGRSYSELQGTPINLTASPMDYKLRTKLVRVVKITSSDESGGTGDNPGTTDLISWWKMDETTGTRYDSHGTNHLAPVGDVTYTTGKNGNAVDLEYTTDYPYLTIADNASLSMGDIAMTIGGWVCDLMTGSARKEMFMGKMTNATTGEYWLGVEWRRVGAVDAVYPYFRVTGDGTTWTAIVNETDIATSPVSWHFILAWHDPTANAIYLSVDNGTAVTAAHTTGIYDGTGAFTFSGDGTISAPWMNLWEGYLDEMFVFKSVLTAAERTWLYNSGTGRAYSEVLSVTLPTTLTALPFDYRLHT